MIDLEEIGRLPIPEDNCAIATRTLAAGTAVRAGKSEFSLSHTVLEGHRFAVEAIPAGAALLSWGMPFGRALSDIRQGEYVCNPGVLAALSNRPLEFDLPAKPNFADDLATYHFDSSQFQPAPALPHKPAARTFMGIARPGQRGVGTRNTIVLLGANALVSGFTRQLAQDTQPLAKGYGSIDDIVAVTHTEGSQAGSNNQELLLRALAGYMVHPNVGAVLVLDAGDIGVTNAMLRDFALRHGYPLDDVLHHFMSLRGPFAADLARGTAVISAWLPRVDAMQRSVQPLSKLKIALQCGGSDAFSGISGNPLAAWVSKEVLTAGGSAVLAETDELIGAESYVLQKVRDAATAERFLATMARFQDQVARHGHSAKGNPSGGNLYRGLYNIYLKSLGAATKRHPDVRLDYVIEYGEPMDQPGYYFMDSPGNDLESIAGQVAAGCNLIYFVTGNGSITNFPFVPTIKIVTTSERYELLPHEMDINAGAYLDGTPLATLGKAALDLSLEVASGRRSAGEKASHAQVQIWRKWQLSRRVDLDSIRADPRPDGQPLVLDRPEQPVDFSYAAWRTEQNLVADRVGLILPSSLCSGQIAQMAARQLSIQNMGREKQISRFVSLVHTEGCGVPTQAEFVDTMLGYLAHPLVASCLVLEHGCEKTHNDFWRHRLHTTTLDPQKIGWASVQLDGGIQRVLAKIETWFAADIARSPMAEAVTAGFANLRLGLMSQGDVDDETAVALANLTRQIATAGGTVILPMNDSLASQRSFRNTLRLSAGQPATLAYAQHDMGSGFHLMANPSTQWAETMSGLGATGVEIILALIGSYPQQSHPFIPVVQAAVESTDPGAFYDDIDVMIAGDAQQRQSRLLSQLAAVLSRTEVPKLTGHHNFGFQITRGRLGVSL